MENQQWPKVNEVSSQNDDESQNKKMDIYGFIDKEIDKPSKYVISAISNHRLIFVGCVELFNFWSDEVDHDKVQLITEIMLETTKYMAMDDILDNSDIREGKPTAHNIYGIANVVISVDFAFAACLDKVLALNHPEAVKIYLDAYSNMCKSEGIEKYWTNNFIAPSEEEYSQMVLLKAASPFFAVAKLIQLFSRTKKDMTRIIVAMGLYAQIYDDYNNLKEKGYHKSKGFCDDISEGKFGFPTVHAINNYPDVGRELIAILRQEQHDLQTKKYYCSLLEKCGSFKYTRKTLEELKDIMREEDEKLGKNPYLDMYLNVISRLY